jgi:hypothetical protein
VNRLPAAELFGAAKVHTDCRIENAVALFFNQTLCVQLQLMQLGPLARTAQADAWLQLERDIVFSLANRV